MILAILLSDDKLLDKPIWPHSKGYCSVSSAYRFLSRPTEPNESQKGEWSWLWKIDCEPKLKLFIWRILYNGIPTQSNLHWIDDKQCNICGRGEESIIHLLRKCTLERCFWRILHIQSTATTFT